MANSFIRAKKQVGSSVMNLKDHIKIKVCGMTQMKQVIQLAELGVYFAGFIFYKKSPRYAAGKIAPKDLKNSSLAIKKVGVFVNETSENILKTVETYGLDWVQLHGEEKPGFCTRISSQVHTIKAFRITGEENLTSVLKDYHDAVDMYLFDTKAKEYGGTGKKFNWTVLQQSVIQKPFFLSGGIGPDDAELIKNISKKNLLNNTFSLDINSKFEEAPGIKSIPTLKGFFDEMSKEL